MTYRDFFRAAIKLFALFALINSLMGLFSYNIITIFDYMELNPLLIVTSLSVIMVGFYVIIIKNPDSIINFLNLDKGFDEEKIMTSKTSAFTLLKVGIVGAGIYLILTNLSFFVYSTVNYYIQSNFYESISSEMAFNFSLEFIQIIVGVAFIALRDRIAGLFETKTSQLEEL
jgi:hypothetical protein